VVALFIHGLIAHLVADWFLQNDWMANNKKNPRSAAGYVHAAIHLALLVLVFPFAVALAVAFVHWLIDLRTPLYWWRRSYRQTKDPNNPVYIPFSMWQDQAAHIVVLYVAAVLVGGA